MFAFGCQDQTVRRTLRLLHPEPWTQFRVDSGRRLIPYLAPPLCKPWHYVLKCWKSSDTQGRSIVKASGQDVHQVHRSRCHKTRRAFCSRGSLVFLTRTTRLHHSGACAVSQAFFGGDEQIPSSYMVYTPVLQLYFHALVCNYQHGPLGPKQTKQGHLHQRFASWSSHFLLQHWHGSDSASIMSTRPVRLPAC